MDNIEYTDKLPVDDQKRLRVHLVPMPSGDNPWRTREDYIKDRRQGAIQFYVSLAFLVVAIISAVFSYWQVTEARKERIKAEEAMKATKEIARLLVNFSEVDHGVGYSWSSFKVREIAGPYLYAKVKGIAKTLDIPVDDRVPTAFRKWASLKDEDPAKQNALNELEEIIKEKSK